MKTALIAAIVAAVVAAASATAATIIVTSKNIKDGTIQTVDISAKAKRTLKGNRGPRGVSGAVGPAGAQGAPGQAGPQGLAGAQGPAGQQGDQGERGPEGPQGPSGVSTAYARDDTFPQVVFVPDDGGPIARIYLPAGKFAIFASISLDNPGAAEALVRCEIANPNGGNESTSFWATLGPATSAPHDAASIAAHALVLADAAEYHYLQCADFGASVRVRSIPLPELSAIEVDLILGGFKP